VAGIRAGLELPSRSFCFIVTSWIYKRVSPDLFRRMTTTPMYSLLAISMGAPIIALSICESFLCCDIGNIIVPFSMICGTAANAIAFIRPIPWAKSSSTPFLSSITSP